MCSVKLIVYIRGQWLNWEVIQASIRLPRLVLGPFNVIFLQECLSFGLTFYNFLSRLKSKLYGVLSSALLAKSCSIMSRNHKNIDNEI